MGGTHAQSNFLQEAQDLEDLGKMRVVLCPPKYLCYGSKGGKHAELILLSWHMAYHVCNPSLESCSRQDYPFQWCQLVKCAPSVHTATGFSLQECLPHARSQSWPCQCRLQIRQQNTCSRLRSAARSNSLQKISRCLSIKRKLKRHWQKGPL